MKHLLSHLPELANRRLFLMLDYDGTLTEIVKHPKKAKLGKSLRRTLERLLSRHRVVVLSGRKLSDVKRLVGLEGLYVGGNHGLEIRGPRLDFVHPGASKLKPAIRRILREAKGTLKSIRGVLVEAKGLSVSFHYRMVERKNLRRFRSEVKRILRRHARGIRVVSGKKVIEARPDVDWDKGKAVLWLIKRVDPSGELLPVYIGDDRTDEDAFAALRGRGVTVLVSRRPRSSKAEYYLRDPGEVGEFLQRLSSII
jgi:trehalose-phosphatase